MKSLNRKIGLPLFVTLNVIYFGVSIFFFPFMAFFAIPYSWEMPGGNQIILVLLYIATLLAFLSIPISWIFYLKGNLKKSLVSIGILALPLPTVFALGWILDKIS